MRIPLLLVQIILLVLWYAVPAMASVPAWAIFLPSIFVGLVVTIPLAFALLSFLLVCVIGLVEAGSNTWSRRKYTRR